MRLVHGAAILSPFKDIQNAEKYNSNIFSVFFL